MNTMLTNKRIAIVGGGPGGLTLARLLQIQNHEVTVYERDAGPEVRPQGSTLDLHEDAGLRALEAAGLMEAFRAQYRPGADKMRITGKEALVLHDDHDEKPLEDFGSLHFRPEIDRGPLRDLLVASLKAGSIVWNSHFLDMKPSGSGWELRFGNGSSAYADLVIAADGANSRLRPYLTAIRPIYSGITVVEGTIYEAEKQAPALWALTKGGKVFSLADGQSIILSTKGDGSLSFYTGTKEKESWLHDSGIDFSDHQQVQAWFKSRFGDWAPVWDELFGSEALSIIPRPMYHFPLDQCWEATANLTMIGDAAHRMPPYAGEGVNMAMQDALELYEALCAPEAEDLQTAIATFEAGMCRRAAEVTRITLAQTESIHSPEGLQKLLSFFKTQS